ncbi:hypothetical protein IscW_ISCW003115 [Ixodes scapularis]|uniref:Uncharacterized protein n=1 Tax=Ixodes scapularis TaxID=6945 RepID=B7PBE4_IXOSC|nr:hypothetical protein IscW_ISCW003115 [Ixodes scapularis]|eukprot:XP_002407997.1 hypothetical protein IscW_ISCW003115 [Ixodes scapularis]
MTVASLRSDKTYRTERAQACKESFYNQPSISHVTCHAHQLRERSTVTLATTSFKLFMTSLHQYCNVPPPSTYNLLGELCECLKTMQNSSTGAPGVLESSKKK